MTMRQGWLERAWSAGEVNRTERRDRQRLLRQHGMRVSGASVKVLATLVPKPKKRKRRR